MTFLLALKTLFLNALKAVGSKLGSYFAALFAAALIVVTVIGLGYAVFHKSPPAASAVVHTAVITASRDSARADALQKAAVAQTQRADSLLLIVIADRARFRALAATTPPACTTLVAAADTVIRVDSSAALALKVALDSTRAEADSLRAARVATVLATPAPLPKPSLLSRIAPHKSLGITAGIDQSGHPALVAGVSLGWGF